MLRIYTIAPLFLFLVIGCGSSSSTGQQEKPKTPDEVAMELFNKYETLSDAEKKGEEGRKIFEQLKDLQGVKSEKLREAMNRMTAANNLRQIQTAIANYQDEAGKLPPGLTPPFVDKDGKQTIPVNILPFIENDNIFKVDPKSPEVLPAPREKKD